MSVSLSNLLYGLLPVTHDGDVSYDLFFSVPPCPKLFFITIYSQLEI